MAGKYRIERYSERNIDFCNDSFLMKKKNEYIMSLLNYCYLNKAYKGLDSCFYEYILNIIDDTVLNNINKDLKDREKIDNTQSLAQIFEDNHSVREKYFVILKNCFRDYYYKNKSMRKSSFSHFKKNYLLLEKEKIQDSTI